MKFYKVYLNIRFDPNVIYFIRKRIHILNNLGSGLQKYHFLSSSSPLFPFSTLFSTAAIYVKLSLAKSICFVEMVIVSDLKPLHGLQAQSMVSMFIQTGSYAELIVYVKPFLVSQPRYVQSTFWSLVLWWQYFTSIWRKLGVVGTKFNDDNAFINQIGLGCSSSQACIRTI